MTTTKKTPSKKAIFSSLTQEKVEKILTDFKEGVWDVGPGQPVIVEKINILKFNLIQNGLYTDCTSKVLFSILEILLKTDYESAQVLTKNNACPKKLLENHIKEINRRKQYDLFCMLLNKKIDIETSFDIAFSTTLFEIIFLNEAEKKSYQQILLMDQKREILNEGKPSQEVLHAILKDGNHLLINDKLISNEKTLDFFPFHGSILKILWDGTPISVNELCQKAMGINMDFELKKNLSKRISEINKKLKDFWGKSDQKNGNWIIRKGTLKQGAYQLFKPNKKD